MISAQRLRQALIDRFGIAVNRTGNLYPWQVSPALAGSRGWDELPPGAADVLRADSPRLVELTARYAAFDPVVTSPAVWRADTVDGDDLRYFRSDNAYVFQLRSRNGNELSYAATYYAAAAGRDADLLARLTEDRLFGIHGWSFDGRIVTRDLLDSVSEIGFLRRHVDLGSGSTLLDIGAGYGRLAHRLAEVCEATICATDAFAASTFLCEYYLGFRQSRATVVPLDEIDALLADRQVDVATNIHSFSECMPEAIGWWTARLAAHGVRHLMVIPNASGPDGSCLTNDGVDMDAIFACHGYRLAVREPRYADPVLQRWGVDGCLISLFELDDARR